MTARNSDNDKEIRKTLYMCVCVGGSERERGKGCGLKYVKVGRYEYRCSEENSLQKRE